MISETSALLCSPRHFKNIKICAIMAFWWWFNILMILVKRQIDGWPLLKRMMPDSVDANVHFTADLIEAGIKWRQCCKWILHFLYIKRLVFWSELHLTHKCVIQHQWIEQFPTSGYGVKRRQICQDRAAETKHFQQTILIRVKEGFIIA